jgi:hypothetical protein
MRRAIPWLVAGLGGALVAAGVVLFVVANRGTADFGWSAYTPLEPSRAYQSSLTLTFSDRTTVLWTGRHLLGAGLVTLGLLVLTGVCSWLLGLRTGLHRSAGD